MSGGALALGKYTPVGRLGSGGMADVFLVLARGPERVERLAVVKQLRRPGDAALTQMFLDEARLTVRLNHPNVVHTYEVGESKGEYFITMEYLEGQPLSELMVAMAERSGGLSDACIASVATQALKGLHYAHEFCDFDGTPLGIVHRDVSPHNLYVTYDGEVKLLDFGIAKAVLNSTQTESGVLKGKVRYMSPEQAGEKPVDRRADMFAFGVVLWEMLARRPLFTGDVITVLTQLAALKIPPLRNLRPEISPELEAIVARALARKPDDRYATAEQMRLELQRALPGGDDPTAKLAGVMNDLFGVKRDALRSQIRRHISNRGREREEETSGEPGLPPKHELPTLVMSTEEPGPSLMALTTGQRRRRRLPRRWLVGGAGAAFALAALIAVVAIGHMKREAPAAAVDGRASSSHEPPRVARLHLETAPPDAFVEWNGQRFGPTPLNLFVEPGAQRLAITRSGYEPAVITLDARPGDDLARAVTLQALAAPARAPNPSAASARSDRGIAGTSSASRPGRQEGVARSSPIAPSSAAPPPPAPSGLNVRLIDEDEDR